MKQKSQNVKEPAEKVVRDIRRKTRKQYSAEENIRIVLSGLRGEDSIAALCRRARQFPQHVTLQFLEVLDGLLHLQCSCDVGRDGL